MLAVVNNGTHFLEELKHSLGVVGVDYELLSGGAEISASMLRIYEGIILTGGDAHVYEPDELATVWVDGKVLEMAEIPVLGICLGHQLIARHYGASIQPLPNPINGEETIEIMSPDVLFAGLSGRFRARIAHDDEVVRLAGPLLRLARSAIGEHEAIRHNDRPVYGLQFHPEASGASGVTILRNFAGLCHKKGFRT